MRTAMKLFLTLGLFFCLSHLAFAKSEAEIRQWIEDTIGQRHPTDTPDSWRALGSSAPSIIISMYEGNSHIFQRLRLLGGLAWFDDPQATQFLKQQADGSSDDVIRNAAIKSIGSSQGAKEEDYISKFLSNPDAQTRFIAADTLKRLNDPKANQVVEKYLSEEKQTWISQRLKEQTPVLTQPLKVVGSSEDALNSNFAGTWRGFWVYPLEAKIGMQSDAVMLKLRLEQALEANGELSVEAPLPLKDKRRAYDLKHTRGRSAHLSGELVEKALTGTKEPTPFEADLVQEKGNFLLHVKTPKNSGVLTLRRDP